VILSAALQKFIGGLDHIVSFMIDERERGAPSCAAPRTETLISADYCGFDGVVIISEEPGSTLGTADVSQTSTERSTSSADRITWRGGYGYI